jgi:aldose 1-epimerase
MSSSSNTEESLIGRCATILPLGALIHSFRIGPSQQNIVQNFPTADLYREYNEPYFGETIGRVANRISGAKIHRLNGRSYELAANNGPNSLHGGVEGWGKKVWDGPDLVSRDGREVLRFRLLSGDGDEGFPGEVECQVWYAEGLETGQNGEEVSILEIEYEAELLGEKGVEETVVNLTNHR